MRHPWLPLLALTAAPPAFALEVAHDPVTCAAPDRYVRIVARGVPAESVAGGEVGFRAGPQSDWYTVAMAAEGGTWTAFIPRPTAALARFEYRVALTGTDAVAVATPPVDVSVDADCPGDAGTAVATAIRVRVPPGAPAIPPVPPGFSPVGAIAPAAAVARGSRTGVKVLTGIGLAGLAGGVAVAAGSATGDDREGQQEADIPTFAFERTVPAPGASLSAQRDMLQVFVRMDHELRAPLDLDWSFELSATEGGPVCAVMFATYNDAQRPTGLVFSAPLQVSGLCGTTFDVASTRLRILTREMLALDQRIGLPYKITP